MSITVRAEPPQTGVTYGFEVEYVVPRSGDPFVSPVNASQSNVRDYPLDGSRTLEASGNWEVRSVPFASLDEAVAAMKRMSEKLGGDRRAGGSLRSFHLRVRLPVAKAKASQPALAGYAVGLANESFLWRLENLDPVLSIGQKTLQRVSGVEQVTDRRAVRFKTLEPDSDNPLYDVELRAFTGDVDEYEKKAKEIAHTFTTVGDAELAGMNATWEALNSRKYASVGDFLDVQRKKMGLAPLDKAAQVVLWDADGGMALWEVLLNGLEDHPALTPAERARIQRANEIFTRRMDAKMKAFYERMRIDFQPYSEFRADYTGALREWAQEAQIHSAIEAANKRLLTDSHLEAARALQIDRNDARLIEQLRGFHRTGGYEVVDTVYTRALEFPRFARHLKEHPEAVRFLFSNLRTGFNEADPEKVKKLISALKAVAGQGDADLMKVLNEQERKISTLKWAVGLVSDCLGAFGSLFRRGG